MELMLIVFGTGCLVFLRCCGYVLNVEDRMKGRFEGCIICVGSACIVIMCAFLLCKCVAGM